MFEKEKEYDCLNRLYGKAQNYFCDYVNLIEQKATQDGFQQSSEVKRYIEMKIKSFYITILQEYHVACDKKYLAFCSPTNDWIHFRMEPHPTHFLMRINYEIAGWKCRVSVYPDDLDRAWPIIKRNLFNHRVSNFKLITKPAKFEDGQNGKQVVIYMGFDADNVECEKMIIDITNDLQREKIRPDTSYPRADHQINNYISYRNDYMDRRLLEKLIKTIPDLTIIVNKIFNWMNRYRASYVTLYDIENINNILKKLNLPMLNLYNPSDIPTELAKIIGLNKEKFSYEFYKDECAHFNPFSDYFNSLKNVMVNRDAYSSVCKTMRSKL